ncbi:hypothetical protein ACFYW6_38855 [Streptomyces sp. NPDC002659]|uniref:hypothetical protein n=1 Tax=Streptomyces sp. NPDC002659 TaxID=3364656 RepID=UPI0036CB5ECD
MLRHAGLGRAHRVGQEVRFEPHTRPLVAASAWLDVLAAHWDKRLAVLAHIAEGLDERDEV